MTPSTTPTTPPTVTPAVANAPATTDLAAAAPVTPTLGSGAMFDRIARRYDFVNRVLSLGLDQGWRRRTVRALQLGEQPRVLDVATGTGDLAIAIARSTAGATVVGLDPSNAMLAVGQIRRPEGDLAEIARQCPRVTGP